ncbi:hypothetical protein PVAG01_10765 [Phlyctema vagabunda]|uniref:Uncharacterized protein n=1 Tax=Phlyctema vagabunda TaxID=108571 RepID=A0ABR4P364_9HELO
MCNSHRASSASAESNMSASLVSRPMIMRLRVSSMASRSLGAGSDMLSGSFMSSGITQGLTSGVAMMFGVKIQARGMRNDRSVLRGHNCIQEKRRRDGSRIRGRQLKKLPASFSQHNESARSRNIELRSSSAVIAIYQLSG